MCDARGPFNALGISFFWLLWGMRHDRERTLRNLDACQGADVLRIFCCVGQPGDSWGDRIIDPTWPDFQDVLAASLDAMNARGMRALVTIFADVTQYLPDEGSRAAHVERVCDVLNEHPERVYNVGISNEGIGFPDHAEILRHVARVQEQTPFLVSSVCSIEDAPATVYAARTERKTTGDGGMWEHTEQPYDLRETPLIASDEEPIGPQSSVAEDDDPLRNTTHAACAWLMRAPLYVFHCGAGIRGGGQADLDRGRPANFYDDPVFPPSLLMLRWARDFLPGDLAQWDGISHSNPRYAARVSVCDGAIATARPRPLVFEGLREPLDRRALCVLVLENRKGYSAPRLRAHALSNRRLARRRAIRRARARASPRPHGTRGRAPRRFHRVMPCRKPPVLPAPAPPDEGAPLTIADVCRQLKTNRVTVARLIRDRMLRFSKLGRVYRFRQAWIDDYIDRAGRAR